MPAISIFNDVLGPVMRGPSSSHTAAPYHIGRMARALLLGPEPGQASAGPAQAPDSDRLAEASFLFDPGGSFAQVYRQQGSDLGFVAGLLGWSLTDERFPQVLEVAAQQGVEVRFSVAPLDRSLPSGTETGTLPRGTETGTLHPNTVEMSLRSRQGRSLHAVACSTGGGALVFTRVGGWPVWLTGDAHELLVEGEPAAEGPVRALLGPLAAAAEVDRQESGGRILLHARCTAPPEAGILAALESLPGVSAVWAAEAIFYPQRGAPLFAGAAGMVAYAEERGISLGEAALAYEAALLGLSPAEVLAETLRRFEVMRSAVHRGLAYQSTETGTLSTETGTLSTETGPPLPPMQLLRPSAGDIFDAERKGRLPAGGLHTRAAARAMAVMHINGGMGVVCAAPTAGSAGTIPGVLVTLAEEPDALQRRSGPPYGSRPTGPGGTRRVREGDPSQWTPSFGTEQGPGGPGLDERAIALALLAASGIGLVVAERATFAAEVAGCQVEIGAAGAMAAAAVVEAAGGSARQAVDAAAIAFQNTMGLVCDMVQGIVEIPCHTRNAAAAANAFLCADLILGGYHNPIPLDETVDAVMAVGQMLPRELKVTALGGLALAPSARALPLLR
jgi:L-serine dehydratase